MTVGLLNPLKVSSSVNIPKRNKLNIESNAIISGVNLPQMNKAIVMIKIASIKLIDGLFSNFTVKLVALQTNNYDECHAFILL